MHKPACLIQRIYNRRGDTTKFSSLNNIPLEAKRTHQLRYEPSIVHMREIAIERWRRREAISDEVRDDDMVRNASGVRVVVVVVIGDIDRVLGY